MTGIKLNRVGLVLMLTLAGCLVDGLAGGLPRLGGIYYGQVRNAFGRPVQESDGVVVSLYRSGTNEVARCNVGEVSGPGFNYQLQVSAVAPGEVPDYGVAVEGESLTLTVRSGGAVSPVIGPDTWVVAGSGTCISVDLVLGTDSDSDGLPDEWEQFIIAAHGSSSGITNIAQITAAGDIDQDGASNGAEFLAGSFAFLPTDVLRIEEWKSMGTGGCKMRFLGNAGFSYEIHSASNLLSGAWKVVRVRDETNTVSAVRGTGDFKDVYHFPTNGCSDFFRIVVR